jgi:hypothetical protein
MGGNNYSKFDCTEYETTSLYLPEGVKKENFGQQGTRGCNLHIKVGIEGAVPDVCIYQGSKVLQHYFPARTERPAAT